MMKAQPKTIFKMEIKYFNELTSLTSVFTVLKKRVMDGWTNRQTDGRTDGQTDGPTDGQTNGPFYRDARTHLEMMK